jgi:hypothetical protein
MSDEALLRRVVGFIFDYIFTGKPRELGGRDNEQFVEYGVSRFKGDYKSIVTDEPLALLATMHLFTTETPWNLQSFLWDALSNANECSRGYAFEHVGTYLLGLAFKAPIRLAKVFDFVVPSSLDNEVAELVALEKSPDGTFSCFPVDISSHTGPTYTLGCTPPDAEGTLAWLQDPKRTIFFFPAKTIRPDLIMILRLSNGMLLRVLVQFRNIMAASIGPKQPTEAFRTADSKQFLSHRCSEARDGHEPRPSELDHSSPPSEWKDSPPSSAEGDKLCVLALVC